MTERPISESPALGPELGRKAQACQRRSHLLSAALRLFSEKGFENSSIKDLAEEVGVAPGLVYHYFETKHQLLIAVVEEHGFFTECARLIDSFSHLPARQGLKKIANAYFRILGEKEQLVRIFCREAMTDETLKAYWVRLINETVSQLSRYLDSRVEAGELRPHNSEAAARLLLHPIAMLRLTGGSVEATSEFVNYLLGGIQAEKLVKTKGKKHA